MIHAALRFTDGLCRNLVGMINGMSFCGQLGSGMVPISGRCQRKCGDISTDHQIRKYRCMLMVAQGSRLYAIMERLFWRCLSEDVSVSRQLKDEPFQFIQVCVLKKREIYRAVSTLAEFCLR